MPTAGQDLTLTCTVVSDRPPLLRWIGPNGEPVSGEGIAMSPPIASGMTTRLQLIFLPLHTSHGGIYTCISSVNTSSGIVNATHEFLVRVQSRLNTISMNFICTIFIISLTQFHHHWLRC